MIHAQALNTSFILIETRSISCISHECNYGLEMLICGGAVLRGAEGVISAYSCLKA